MRNPNLIASLLKNNRFFIGSLHVFPGQGVQKPGMILPYLKPEFQPLLNSFDQILEYPLSKYLQEGPQELLNKTEITQPAVFVTSYLAHLTHNKESKVLIGHSVGEYTALTVAGFIKPLETVRILRKRGQLMQEACEGRKCGMLVISGDINKALEIKAEISKNKEFIGQVCELAVYNSRKNHVFSGDLEILKCVSDALKKGKINNLFLRVSAAFHCSLMEKIKEKFKAFLESIEITEGKGTVIRNCDLEKYKKREDIIDGLVKQLTCPVLFYQSVEKAMDMGVDEVIEFGGKSQARVLKEILDGREEWKKIKIGAF